MTAVPLEELVAYLDDYLAIADVPDDPGAINGLQVENSGLVGSIVAAVDASQATIDATVEAARDGAAPLLLVHHGLFWDRAHAVTGRRYRKISSLFAADVALYSAHLPLDVHADVGNNAVLADRLGIEVQGSFGSYKGVEAGVWGTAPPALRDRDRLVATVGRAVGAESVRLIAGGPETVERIGIITGGAGTMIADASAAGLDTFITGEGPHYTYFDAMELGVNVLYAGHYATETLGVQALASHLSERFGLPWEFLDFPTGM